MYSLVLSTDQFPQLAKIDGAHSFVMAQLLTAVKRQLPTAELQGICDLTWQNRKFSGNALRITRRHVLYHGTILYAADLGLIDDCLAFAPRQPQYRSGRDHQPFVTNAPLDPETLGGDLAELFGASPGPLPDRIVARARELVSRRYSCEEWRFRH